MRPDEGSDRSQERLDDRTYDERASEDPQADPTGNGIVPPEPVPEFDPTSRGDESGENY